MQDRFKFRIFLKAHNHMCNVHTLHTGTNKVIVSTKYGNVSVQINDYNILMQCTGLKDKNGKLIYEGDIVKVYDISAVGYVRERIGTVVYGYSFYPEFIIETTLGDVKDFTEDIEVIGNIYENPELFYENPELLKECEDE